MADAEITLKLLTTKAKEAYKVNPESSKEAEKQQMPESSKAAVRQETPVF
jgi:hypothetical protein